MNRPTPINKRCRPVPLHNLPAVSYVVISKTYEWINYPILLGQYNGIRLIIHAIISTPYLKQAILPCGVPDRHPIHVA